MTAIDRRHRHFSDHGEIQGGAQAIDVGPGALLVALAVVLFEWREARRYHGRDGLRLLAQRLTGGTEVQ